ncbi:hypothetical protein DFP73DRAFT_540096 [Morchella snyderi]|nr:hypothetical protein DFP73DRAFT_540096 [Morchella snyderi]
MAPHPLHQQVQQQPQSSALPPSVTHAPPLQQGQPQYAPVPIPQGYARPQGEYAYQQQHLQQAQGHRQESTNIDPRTGQSPSINISNISPSINRNPSQVSSQISDIRTLDSRNISPNLSRAGTQASRTYETTRSLSPNSEVGTQYGRRPSVREGDISEHPSSSQPSIKEGEAQNDSQRYQQPLPLPQSVAQVKNSGSDHEISPRSTPLPVSPPPTSTPFGPPPTQIEERSKAVSPTPPPHPPKVVENNLPETEKMSPHDAGPSRQPGDTTGLRDSPPAFVGASHASANENTPTLAHRETEEEYDFSTEKIAVNLDLHGETSKPFKKVGTEDEEEYTMSATAYPGQEWYPSYY